MSTYGVARFDPYAPVPRTPNLTAATASRQVDQLSGDVVRLTRERDDALASLDVACVAVRDVTNALQSVNCQCEELAEENASLRCRIQELQADRNDLQAQAARP